MRISDWSSDVCSSVLPAALHAARPDARFVMLTGYGNIATAVEAVKAGAIDYLPKPADADQITAALLEIDRPLPPPPEDPLSADRGIGRASSRERGCQSV